MMIARIALATMLSLAQGGTEPAPWIAELRRAVAVAELGYRSVGPTDSVLEALAAAGSRLDEDVLATRTDEAFAAAREWLRLRAELTASHGDLDGAVSLLSHALEPREGEALDGIQTACAALPADSRLRGILSELRARQSAIGGEDASQGIDEAVREAWAEGNLALVADLGIRAVPALVKIVREDPGGLPPVDRDPLPVLFRKSRAAFDDVLGELRDRDDLFWNRRVVRAMQPSSAWLGADDFAAAEDGTQRSVRPHITAALERYLLDPDLGFDAFTITEQYSARDALTPAMIEAARERLETNPDPDSWPFRLLWPKGADPSKLDALRALLASPSPAVRAKVLKYLLEYPTNEGLYALASDPAVEVRFELANALKPRGFLQYPAGRGDRSRPEFAPEFDVEYLACLDRLLSDTESIVRRRALDVYLGLDVKSVHQVTMPTWPDESLRESRLTLRTFDSPRVVSDPRLVALAKDPDGEIRRALAGNFPALPTSCWREVGLALAADEDGKVLDELHGGLRIANWYQHFASLFPVLATLRGNPATPYHSEPDALNGLQSVVEQCSRTKEGFEALVDFCLRDGNPASFQWLGSNLFGQSPRESLTAPLRLLDPQRFVSMARSTVEGPAQGILRIAGLDPAREQRDALAEAANSPDASERLAVLAVVLSSDGDAPHFVDLFVRALGVERLPADTRGWLQSGVNNCTNEQRARIAELAFAEPDVTDSNLRDLLQQLENFRFPLAEHPRVGTLALERWHGDSPASASPEDLERLRILWRLAAHAPIVVPSNLLVEAVHADPTTKGALEAVAVRREPADLPLLRELIHGDDRKKFDAAVSMLPSFLSDEAAELLLEAAALTPASDQREWCIAQLEKIREYQEAKERWAARKVKALDRTRLVAELLGLLDEGTRAQRIEALKGLATLEGIEALPRIIRLLEADDADLVAAARAALDRLNREP